MGSSKKKSRGRPRKNPEDVRSKIVQTRATPEEHEQLLQAAEDAGETLSSWLLRVALKAAQRAQRRR